METSRYLSKNEVAVYLRISLQSVEKLIGEGHLNPIRLPLVRGHGNMMIFDRLEVDTWLATLKEESEN